MTKQSKGLAARLPLLVGDRAAAIEQLHTATALYTAHPIVDRLLNRIGCPGTNGTLLDPCCGDGSFLHAALTRLIERGTTCTEILDRLCGCEIHAGAVRSARDRIGDTLDRNGFDRRLAQAIVHEGDFLTETFNRKVRFIATNPPYLRFVNLHPLLRTEYEARTPDFANADMLHAFLFRCAEHLTLDGTIATVTSDRWLMTSNAAELRERLGARFSIAHLARLDITTSFYRPKHRTAGTPPRIHPVELVLHRGAGTPLSRLPIYPDATTECPDGQPLDTLAKVRLAPWLGTPGIFAVSPAVARRLPPEVLVPAIDTDAIRLDDTLAEPTLFAIRTTAAKPPQAVLDHLAQTMPTMCERGRRKSGPFWLPPETWTEIFPLQHEALLIPRIARRLRIIRLPAGYVPINHNLTVIVAPDRLCAIEAALRSDECQQWVATRAHRLENGHLSIMTSLLRKLPIPRRFE